ncbi:efflux RND transporter permease subunit [candidate division CSSED10-310 bacterium]|uniref:Efflux RND transporter permease subunit n=1 Tax=candidate division CSSED10-310 bacterium TaxID=2855610 RepID=A0ABV6YYJ2_UNCC1
MNVPRYAIANYQFTIVVILLLVLSGVVSLSTMPRSEDPQVTNSGGSIYVVYPGANPMDLEELIIDPIEEALNELEDIKKIDSYMEDGLAVTHIEFESGTDPDEKYSDVLQKVNSIQNRLPRDIAALSTQKWAISNVNILQVAIVSASAEYKELEQEAERLKTEFEKVAGVKKAEIWAFPEQEVRVAVDLEKMAQYRIPLSQITGAIQSANMNIPGGYVDIGSRRFNVQTSGALVDLEALRFTVVHSQGSEIVYLKDVADVFFTYKDDQYQARINGKRAVFVTAMQKEQTNIFTIRKNLNAVQREFKTELPASMSLFTVFDQSESVSRRLNSFFSNLLQGLILVSVVVLFAVGLRAAVIVMLAIPISIFIGIGLVDISGYGIEQMSIAGLVIALGLLVDNAIVVTENISRFLRMGKSHQEAAVAGTSQIAWAIISATATTVLAFVPVIMMRNITGEFIRSMPLTVVYTLLASLFMALTLTPFLSSKFLSGNGKIERGFGARFFKRLVETYYRSILDFALKNRKTVLFAAVVILGGSVALFPLVGVSFFPKAEKPQIIINISTPHGTSLAETDQAARFAERILSQDPNVKHYATNVGRSNPRIYYNIIPKREKSTHAQLFVELHSFNQNKMTSFLSDLRNKLEQYVGAKIEVKELEQGPPVEAPIAIKIIGDNLDELRNLARKLEQIIKKTPGTVNVRNPLATSKTELHVRINREKAGMLGIPLHEIDRTIRASLVGLPISRFRNQQGQEFDIVIRLPQKSTTTIDDFDRIYCTSVTGSPIPLRHLASLELKASPLQINHYKLERNVTVTADVERGVSVDHATKQIMVELAQIDWPKGYRSYIAGELEQREESFGGMEQAVLVALIAIFGVLVLQFRSFTQPLIVFSAIPLAIIGSIIALLITGYSFSFMAFIGLASLVGIVINNSIILVDYTNQLRARDYSLHQALQEAGETRFRPIILTTVTTIGGLLPLTLKGGSTWAPMGWTIIGGLITSTFLTLVIVPVLYSIFTGQQER